MATISQPNTDSMITCQVLVGMTAPIVWIDNLHTATAHTWSGSTQMWHTAFRKIGNIITPEKNADRYRKKRRSTMSLYQGVARGLLYVELFTSCEAKRTQLQEDESKQNCILTFGTTNYLNRCWTKFIDVYRCHCSSIAWIIYSKESLRECVLYDSFTIHAALLSILKCP